MDILFCCRRHKPEIRPTDISLSENLGRPSAPVNYDTAHFTRNVCLIGLMLSWLIGTGALIAAIYAWVWWRSVPYRLVPYFIPTSVEWFRAATALINLLFQLLNDCLGLLHTTSLRWALQREGRLDFNTNLRLISNAHQSAANSWLANLFVTACVILSYSSVSSIFFKQSPASDERVIGESSGYFYNEMVVNPVALLVLAISILGQAAIVTWGQYITRIPTWSSNPFDTVKASLHEGSLQRVKGRCMLSVEQTSESSLPAFPRTQQCPQYRAHRQVRRVVRLVWSLVPLGMIFSGVMYGLLAWPPKKAIFLGAPGTNWSLLPVGDDNSQVEQKIKELVMPLSRQGQDMVAYSKAYWRLFSPSIEIMWQEGKANRFAAAFYCLLLSSAFQGILTLALHCIELLINLSRDEATWRATSSREGSPANYNSIIAACTSWETICLFLFKAAINWLNGTSFSLWSSGRRDNVGIQVLLRPIQIFYLTLCTAILALIATFICFRRPEGPQPATYGHLQTLADLIDEWSPHMYWGHKAVGNVCHAGTSAKPLQIIRMDRQYSGSDNKL